MAENTNTPKLSPEKVLSESLKNAQDLYPQMVESSTKAKIALTKVQKIETDAEDEYANTLLVAVRKTYDKVKGWRTTITGQLDGLKADFMEPEKQISFEASHKDSEALRVKLLRDAYATKKVLAQQEQQKKLLVEQNKKEELAKLKAVFENRFFEAVVVQLGKMEDGVEAHFNSITLETFEDKAKRFNITPKLSAEFYENLFIVDYDKNKLPLADFTAFLTTVKEQMPYSKINGIYVEKAQPIVDDWKAKLPARKTELEELAELAKTNATEAKIKANAITAKAESDRLLREEESKNSIEANRQQNEQKANIEIQDASFETQVAQQSMGTMKNIRQKKVATIVADEVNTVKVLSQIMFACFSNPNFQGHVKKDKTTGAVLKDETGRPIYHDWAETLLEYYANNCDVAIPGVEIKGIVSTITKK